MKMRLLTALIAATCFSQAASADAELTSGTITNKTTATADVVFNQPVTLENTLTPVAGLKAGGQTSADGVTIATGKLAIKETGVTARLAFRTADLSQGSESVPSVYAEGHEGDDEYQLLYEIYPDGATPDKWDFIKTSDGEYLVSTEELSQQTYKVAGHGSGNVLPKAGKYTISVTGAVYTP